MGRNTALVIVDMQPTGFALAKNEGLVRNIVAQVKEFRRKLLPIIVVEYKGSGSTHDLILDALKGYKANWFYVRKDQMSGSKEIFKKLSQKKLRINKFLVAGVYACWCVQETCDGLNKKNKVVLSHSSIAKCSKVECSNCKRGEDKFTWHTPMRKIKEVLAA